MAPPQPGADGAPSPVLPVFRVAGSAPRAACAPSRSPGAPAAFRPVAARRPFRSCVSCQHPRPFRLPLWRPALGHPRAPPPLLL